MLAGILTAISIISGGILWIFQEKIEKSIIEIVKKYEKTDLREDLATKMDIEVEEVDNEIEWMYSTILDLSVTQHHDGEDDSKYASFLDKEIQWRSVGYYVNVEDNSIIKYRHSNGRSYDAWTEPSTGQLYYIKEGFKYY